MTDDTESRLSQLEQKVQALEAVVLVKRELGGQLIEREGVDQSGVEDAGVTPSTPTPDSLPLSQARRAECSPRAVTERAELLTRNFRPSMFGYTADDFKRDYPDVNPTIVLESFLAHHIGKSDKYVNWLEKFWSYAARAQQIEREKRMNNPTETDSMGLPLDRKARNEMLGK